MALRDRIGGGRVNRRAAIPAPMAAGVTETAEVPAAIPADPGWRALPPLRTTIGTQPLLTDPHRFERGLGTRQDPSLHTDVEHVVSADAPSGLALGLLSAVPGTAVQRAVGHGPLPLVQWPELSAVAVDTTAEPSNSPSGERTSARPVHRAAVPAQATAPTQARPVQLRSTQVHPTQAHPTQARSMPERRLQALPPQSPSSLPLPVQPAQLTQQTEPIQPIQPIQRSASHPTPTPAVHITPTTPSVPAPQQSAAPAQPSTSRPLPSPTPVPSAVPPSAVPIAPTNSAPTSASASSIAPATRVPPATPLVVARAPESSSSTGSPHPAIVRRAPATRSGLGAPIAALPPTARPATPQSLRPPQPPTRPRLLQPPNPQPSGHQPAIRTAPPQTTTKPVHPPAAQGPRPGERLGLGEPQGKVPDGAQTRRPVTSAGPRPVVQRSMLKADSSPTQSDQNIRPLVPIRWAAKPTPTQAAQPPTSAAPQSQPDQMPKVRPKPGTPLTGSRRAKPDTGLAPRLASTSHKVASREPSIPTLPQLGNRAPAVRWIRDMPTQVPVPQSTPRPTRTTIRNPGDPTTPTVQRAAIQPPPSPAPVTPPAPAPTFKAPVVVQRFPSMRNVSSAIRRADFSQAASTAASTAASAATTAASTTTSTTSRPAPRTTSKPPPTARPPAPADVADFLSRLERKHLDELARRLADPLDRLARAESYLTRERSGRLRDSGH